MELRQLRYLISAVRCGSLKGAAKENFVTAPAVSIQLKQLEDELGEKLLLKYAHGIKLTQAGEVFLPQAEDILRRVADLKNSIQHLQGCQTGYLRIGSIDAASIYVLPRVFRSFRQRYAGIDIEVMVADSSQLMHALAEERIEVAILTLPTSGEGVCEVPIYDDHMVVVAHPRHALCRRRTAPLTTLAHGRLITYPAGSTTRQLLEQVFIEQGLKLRPAMELSSPEAMKCLTQAGLGASILPKRLVAGDLKRGTLQRVSTPGARFLRTLGVTYKKDHALSPAARAFLDVLGERFGKSLMHNPSMG